MGSKKLSLLILLSVIALVLIGAVSNFYIEDKTGKNLIFGTDGSLLFPRITGINNDIEIIFDHTDLLNKGSYTHSQLDSHVDDSTIHFTEASIDHSNIQNHGSYTHSQIDSHVDDSTIHFSAEPFNNHTSNSTIHFTEASIDHSNIQNHGSYTHNQLDSHVDDSSIHFPIYDNVSSVYSDRVWSSEFSKYYTDNFGGGGGGSLTVTDDTTTVSPTDTIRFDPTGFTVTDDGLGDVTISNLGGTGGGGDVLDENTTCYVSTTGDDTQPCGDSGDACLTPNGCLSRYATYKINPDVFLTIQMADGTYSLTSTIEITHPDGNRIKITGENSYAKTLSSIQSVSGSSGSYSVVLNLNNVTDIAQNDYALISGTTGGTNPTYIQGAWLITNVDSGNNRITVASTHKSTGTPSGAISGSVQIIKAILSFTGCHGIYAGYSKVLGEISNLVVKGTSSYSGLFAETNGLIVGGDFLASVGWDKGFLASSAGILKVNNSFACGNFMGYYPELGGGIISFYAIANGNGEGVYANSFGASQGRYMIASGNTTGFHVHYNAFGYLSNTQSTGNSLGYWAGAYSYALIPGHYVSGNTSDYSPALNTEGNISAYLHNW